ncbi:MAG TPA: DNA polymerase Y family protein [Verrucomicrobiae bacterium]|nr:DNA polymerase Y family protein [Verrucomicrobiae bacterium]
MLVASTQLSEILLGTDNWVLTTGYCYMFACIYVPNFAVAAALRAEPELRTRAIAIFEGKPPLEKIIAVNEKAGDLGISAGMTKAQAELCPELVLRPSSPLHESSAHAALLDCAQSFSPCVEDAARDTVFLDLAGMQSLFGLLPQLSRSLFDRAKTLGLEAHIAIASNPDATLLAARGFSGGTVIAEGKEAEQLGPLPVEVLFAGGSEIKDQQSSDCFLETFARWGIRDLHSLAALPQIALTERLGQAGLHLQQLARGAVQRTLVPVEEPLVFEEAIELEHPITLLEPLAFLLNRLLEQLCARLGSRALATQELRLTLELENFSLQRSKISNQQFSRTLRLPLPMLDAKIFLKLLQLDLSAHPPGAPILKIHLAAEPARPRSAQAGLFLPPSPEPEKLELTLARIAGMVGEEKVGAVELLDTHHPHGFRMRRFGTGFSQKNSRDKCNSESDSPEKPDAITALRRFRPPLRANVILENGQPTRVACKKKEIQGNVLWKAGPWRFSGDWWEREAWSHDEWDIVLETAVSKSPPSLALYRLVHDLLSGGWFVEGTYD